MIFVPLNLGTTGIGSHSLDNPNAVIHDIFESTITYPYIPQLKADEMTLQFHHSIPGLRLQNGTAILDLNTPEFETKLRDFKGNLKMKSLLLQPHGLEITAEFFRGLFTFPAFLNQFSHYRGIKCQITGPITEAASIKLSPGNIKLIQNAELFDMVTNLTAEIAYWLSNYLIKMVKSRTIAEDNVILFIDEPLFPLAVENEISYEKALEKILPILQIIQCTKGIHICDNPITVLDSILKYPIDVFSFDAIKYPNSLKSVNRDILKEYIDRGGGFAFGITPNTPESVFGVENIPDILKGELDPNEFLPTPEDLIHTFEMNIRPLELKEGQLQQLLAQSLITPSCGFRNFNIPTPEEGERIVLRLLQVQEQAAQKLRNLYHLHDERTKDAPEKMKKIE